MVIGDGHYATLRGLFGLTIDASTHTVTVAPHLPADWPSAEVRNLHVGDSVCNLSFVRKAGELQVISLTSSGTSVRLRSDTNHKGPATTLAMPLPPIEVAIAQALPAPGVRTSQMKVLSERYEGRSFVLELEGMAGTEERLACASTQTQPG